MDEYKEGYMYKIGIVVAAAKKNLPKAGNRNPPGTPKELLTCPYYYLIYCQKLVHVSCANKECVIKEPTEEE